MNRMSFGESACEKTRSYLDAYVSSELLVETNHDVLRHLAGCPACSAEVEARTFLRTRLRSAVAGEPVPVELPALVRQRIRTRESRPSFGAAWLTWPLTAAATLALTVVMWIELRPERVPDLADCPAQNVYLQKISSRMAAVLKLGLGDHVHCSVFRKYPKDAPSAAQMEKDFGPEYSALLRVVRAAVPADYRIIMAHTCGYLNRRYVHLTLESRGTLLSLVIARKQDGESLDGLAPATNQGGTPIYQASAGRYHVAAFEAGDFFAYVVSDMKGMDNLQMASAMAPGVREVLLKTPA